jgi:hypothetical protein
MTTNEVRHIKLLPPIAGGDTVNSGVSTTATAVATPAAPETAPAPSQQPDEGAT